MIGFAVMATAAFGVWKMTSSIPYGCFEVDRAEFERLVVVAQENMASVPIGMDFQTIKLKVRIPADMTRRTVLIVTASYPRAGGQYVVYKGPLSDEISLRLPKKTNDATPEYIFTIEFFDPDRLLACAWSTDQLNAITPERSPIWSLRLAEEPPAAGSMEMLWVTPAGRD
ncbi:MAG: hypothetical protein Q4G26_10110 [Paracoccus sp. (in: a-proteobacteria)]|nr:hypothetical protein [Paracoccus sp. (in: a-proteobacteria)]